MNRWVAWGLALVLATWVARAQPSPGLTSAPEGVRRTERSCEYAGQDWHSPVRPRTLVKIGCRHRDPHLGILPLAPGLSRATAGVRQSEGYARHEETVRIVLNPGGPGPPAPTLAKPLARALRLLPPKPENAVSRLVRSSRSLLRRDG